MRRPYFGVIFILVAAALLIAAENFGLGAELYRFMVVLMLMAYYLGQYSMRLPK